MGVVTVEVDQHDALPRTESRSAIRHRNLWRSFKERTRGQLQNSWNGGEAEDFASSTWRPSSTERSVANILDDDDSVILWVRLQIGDLPILWTGGREYNPDLIAVDDDDVHWIIEVKMDKEVASADVYEKRQAAMRWANYVSADEAVGKTWRYLLVSESDVKTAKGTWPALKRLGGY